MTQTTTRNKIIIIGAGAAGLMAAKILSATHEVIILEAREKAGGRMTQGGAEFVHGRLPLTLDLLKEAGLSYTAVEGHMFTVEQGSWQEQEDMIEGWDQLLQQMSALPADTTIQSFLEKQYPEAGSAAFREEVYAFVQGFDLADPAKVSTRYLYNEWIHEGENFRIDQGYAALIQFMQEYCISKGAALLTGQYVSQVHWSPGQVQVTTREGHHFEAGQLLITVPLSLLQQEAISFIPALPAYEAAAQQIGWGSVIKLIFHFTHPFWNEQHPDTGFIFSEEAIPTWWTQAPDNAPVLTGWLGGPPAARYALLTAEEMQLTALEVLSRIFMISLSELQGMLVRINIFNWSADPYAKGAYSYDMTSSPDARQVLLTPVADTLYFAGEALYEGKSPGTVEAALTSGKAVANQIIAAG